MQLTVPVVLTSPVMPHQGTAPREDTDLGESSNAVCSNAAISLNNEHLWCSGWGPFLTPGSSVCVTPETRGLNSPYTCLMLSEVTVDILSAQING